MNAGRHHDTAIRHVATTLLTRLAACLRTGSDYVICDIDGTPITEAPGGLTSLRNSEQDVSRPIDRAARPLSQQGRRAPMPVS